MRIWCRASLAAALLVGVSGCSERPAGTGGGEASAARVRVERQEVRRLQAKVRSLELEVARGELEVARLKEAAGLRREVAEGDFDLWEYAERMEELRAENSRLKKELDEKTLVIARLTDAGVPVADLVAGTDPGPEIHGKVLAVRPEVNLVMLSVGEDEKVRKGFRFSIYRDERYVGKVEVENVFNDMCSARILQDWTRGPVREGDDAATAP